MENRRINYLRAEERIPAQPEQAPPPEPEKQKKQKLKASNLLVGFLVLLLAGFGLYQAGSIAYTHFKNKTQTKQTTENGSLYEYLIPAAAVDLEPFDDVTTAKMSELVEMTVWGVLNSGLDSTQYDYSGDVLILPQAQVEAAFLHYFGAERTIEHQTVSGYGYQFVYDATARCYNIPLTTITPIYTPRITETVTKGESTVLTVGYLNTGMYAQNPVTGELTAPEPDKYVQITLRSASTGTYISAVRSMGLPETAWAYTTLPAVQPTESEPAPGTDASGEDASSGEEASSGDEEASGEEAPEN